jgi:hypothetical protein
VHSGHLTVTDFLELPSKDEVPGYYDFIKLPVALSTIEQKLKRDAYPTITTLESDFKRMVQNAKDFNDPKSEIYEHAEKIRKLVYNFMKVNNPQYATDPGYSSFATPIPSEVNGVQNGVHDDGQMETQNASREASRKSGKRSTAPQPSEPPSERKASVAPSATTGDGEEIVTELDFNGKSFQQVQQDIISYFINYVDPE